MSIVREPPAWNNDAAGLLKEFLGTPVGQAFLAHLVASRPSFVSGDLNAVALRASQIDGYEKCYSTILRLTDSLEESREEVPAYPPLEDDSQWPEKK
jgi:hypothetical protein